MKELIEIAYDFLVEAIESIREIGSGTTISVATIRSAKQIWKPQSNI